MSGDYGINGKDFVPSYSEMISSLLPERKTVFKGAVALAFVAIAGAAIYNREAIKGFVMGKFNHISGGAQAGDAPKAPQIPANGGAFGIDGNGNFGWHATA